MPSPYPARYFEAASRRYEADDLLALAARRGRPRPVVLMSTDKISFSCSSPGLALDSGGAGAGELRPAPGVPAFLPEAMATYLALTGDASDGIPGVLSVSARKTAGAALCAFCRLHGPREALEAQGSEARVRVAGAAGIA